MTAARDSTSGDAALIAEMIMRSRIQVHYQPIVSLQSAEVIGFEALTRGPVGTAWHSPQALFAAAERAGMLLPLESHVQKLAMLNFCWQSDGKLLFLNCHPAALGSFADGSSLGHVIEECTPALRERLILELPESDFLREYPDSEATIARLRSAGIAIALDDYGSQFSGPSMIVRLRPQWLKLDRVLVAGIEQDRWRQEVVRQIAGLQKSLGMCVIAEGIETAAELRTLRALGVQHGQGFLFGAARPIISHL